MKRFFLVTVVLAIFGFAANAQPKGLLGTWKSTTMEMIMMGEVLMSADCAEEGMDMTFTFKPGGVGIGEAVIEGETSIEKLTYKVVGTKVYVKDESGDEVEFTYLNGRLHMEMAEEEVAVRVNFRKK